MRSKGFLIVLSALAITPVLHSQDRARSPVSFGVTEKSIEQLREAMEAGQVTSRQLVELYLARIEAYDQRGPTLNAIEAINPQALAAAEALDAERAAKGPRGPLHGVPVLVKDNYETVEMPTTAGSIALATFHPARDAYLVQRLKQAGAVIIGKTTMHELAAGITTVGSGFGRTRNPYDLDRTPGGSSGGTGAAVAASFAAAGMGSDTCGSIRIPAANNNLVGLRGTRGLSSRRGIVPLSSTQDIGGPIARSVADLAILLDATVGPDPQDPQTVAAAAAAEEQGVEIGGYREQLDASALDGARIGVVRELFGSAPEDQEVTRIVNQSLEAVEKAGAEVVDVTIPGLADLLRNSSLIDSEFKFDLMEYLAAAEDPPVHSLQQILDRGLYHEALESVFRSRNAPETRETDATRRARIKQATLRQVTSAVLDANRLDALVYPTLRRRPARIGDAQSGSTCHLSAHSGLPALSVPAGFTTDGVPIGMELLGPAFSEHELLSLGYSIEQTLDLRLPPFSTPPLIDGKPPAPRTTTIEAEGIELVLTYDKPGAKIRYSLDLGEHADSESNGVSSVWLQSGTPEAPGAARHQLFDARRDRAARVTGMLAVTASDRSDLDNHRMIVRVYPRAGEFVTIQVPPLEAWRSSP